MIPSPSPPYDERYLKGIKLFNQRLFFECHEIWEDLWIEINSEPKQFYQGLIKAAVALHHFRRGNASGARTLYYSCLDLLEPYRPLYHGMDLDRLCSEMERCFAEVLERADASWDETLIPNLTPLEVLRPGGVHGDRPDQTSESGNF